MKNFKRKKIFYQSIVSKILQKIVKNISFYKKNIN